ncbi:uncharacterized protein AB675_8668 [Cyphellophora attinorum]|uniref:Uncharacterized protein n=1 Tax=Cyphellophora attinorum TaxID=1664694 RepID=A0A0N1I089_9EURO|nr:uncharacterized protein AB675_8668 [Phialophora attinorum]KPI44787.1 hypothetical protein AB675_8668 [Phialophora attinorum]
MCKFWASVAIVLFALWSWVTFNQAISPADEFALARLDWANQTCVNLSSIAEQFATLRVNIADFQTATVRHNELIAQYNSLQLEEIDFSLYRASIEKRDAPAFHIKQKIYESRASIASLLEEIVEILKDIRPRLSKHDQFCSGRALRTLPRIVKFFRGWGYDNPGMPPPLKAPTEENVSAMKVEEPLDNDPSDMAALLFSPAIDVDPPAPQFQTCAARNIDADTTSPDAESTPHPRATWVRSRPPWLPPWACQFSVYDSQGDLTHVFEGHCGQHESVRYKMIPETFAQCMKHGAEQGGSHAITADEHLVNGLFDDAIKGLRSKIPPRASESRLEDSPEEAARPVITTNDYEWVMLRG